jgi:hypothetical protein
MMTSDSNPADTPLLLIAWRRPHTLRHVIDAIRPVAPTRLYVACDGPSPERPGEAEKVDATRAVIEGEIDWPCQIERLYSDVNQGCRLGVSNAITWFFEQVEEGIILEDDCVPHPDFFPYCTTLLERYRHDTRVWCITGRNDQKGIWRGDGSYYFSRYPHCWGWASWRSRWVHYDVCLSSWPVAKSLNIMASIFENEEEESLRVNIYDMLFHVREPDTWDYQWSFACFTNSGLTATPNRNIVANIGYGPDATHTTSQACHVLDTRGLPDIKHPSFVVRDRIADCFMYQAFYAAKPNVKNRLSSIVCKITSIINHFASPPLY